MPSLVASTFGCASASAGSPTTLGPALQWIARAGGLRRPMAKDRFRLRLSGRSQFAFFLRLLTRIAPRQICRRIGASLGPVAHQRQQILNVDKFPPRVSQTLRLNRLLLAAPIRRQRVRHLDWPSQLRAPRLQQLVEVLARVPPAVSVDRNLSSSDFNHQPARMSSTPLFFLQLFVFFQAGKNPYPRVITVNNLTIGGQSAQIEEDGQNSIGHRFTSLELNGFRQRHAEALLQSRQPIPRQPLSVPKIQSWR